MRSPFLVALCLAVACAAAGCRMADGPMPTPAGEDTNRLDDLRRDLGDVVGGNAEGRKNFADDLRVFADLEKKPDAAAAIDELARQVADAAVATQLKEAAAPPLLRQVWTAVAARELSEKQVTQLQADVKATLAGLGVAEPAAQSIANQVGTVQKAVTDRQRSWYEVF